jgi:hypothetical protein
MVAEDIDLQSGFSLEIGVIYGQDSREQDFDLAEINKHKKYETFPGAAERHRAFLSVAASVSAAAKKIGADWSVTRITSKHFEPRHPGENYYDGGYAGLLEQVGVLSATVVAVLPVIRALGPALVQYIKNRGATTISVSIGDVKVKVRGEQDIDKVIELVEIAASKARPVAEDKTSPKPKKRSPKKGKADVN